MKAVLYDTYGGPEVLSLREYDPPALGHDEVRVAPVAVSVNAIDGKIRRGELTLMAGRHFPKRIGQDFSGLVTEVGSHVEEWAVGQEVYGCCRGMKNGALGDVATLASDCVAAKPTTLAHTVAASVPMVGLAALQALTHVARVDEGSRVLVNGCTGGVGLFALQIARHLGAEVTGVAATENLALAEAFGAHAVLDYRTASVADLSERFDVVLELSGKLSFEQAERVLTPHGRYVDVSPSAGALIGNALANPLRQHKHSFLLMKPHSSDLARLASWLDDGTLLPPPVREYALESMGDAFEAAEGGRVAGKVVIRVRPEPELPA